MVATIIKKVTEKGIEAASQSTSSPLRAHHDQDKEEFHDNMEKRYSWNNSNFVGSTISDTKRIYWRKAYRTKKTHQPLPRREWFLSMNDPY